MAQININQRASDKDPLSIIAKGLAIAQGVYGIKADMARMDQMEKDNALRDEDRAIAAADRTRQQAFQDEERAYQKSEREYQVKEREKEAKGVLSKKEQLLLQKDFAVSDKPLKGGVAFQREDGSTFYAAEKPKPSGMRKPVGVETVDDQGRPVTKYIIPTEGMVIPRPQPSQQLTPLQQLAQVNRLEKKAENLGKDTQGFAKTFTDIKNVEEKIGFDLDDYDSKANTANGRPVDIPGVSVPVLGRVEEYSDPARKLRTSLQSLLNTEIKDAAGASVTSNEMERIKKEFGEGKFNTESDLLGALKQYKAAARDLMKNVEARYGADAKELFKSNGGFTSDAVAPKGTTFPRVVINPETGMQATVSDADELKAAMAKGFQ